MLPPRPTLDAVCLDAGNTLVGMEWAHLLPLLADAGIAATPAALARAEAAARPSHSRRLAGGRSSEAAEAAVFQVAAILQGLGVANADATERAPRLARRIRAEVPSRRLWSRVLPGVPEALAAMRAAGLRLVVVSNSDGTVEALLGDVGLRDAVDAVVDSTHVGAEKPDPAIFAHALRHAGTAPERALHVGDLHAVDVVGARAAGLHAVLLDPHGDWGDVDCAVVPDVSALARALLGDA